MDDRCALTYGHPYAKPSHPFFSVDGEWYRLEEYVGRDPLTPELSDNALRVQSRSGDEGNVVLSFTVSLRESGALLEAEIANLDDRPHTCRVGIAVDPALGRWGDGYLALGDAPSRHGTRLRAPDLPPVLTLWERAGAPKGLGVDCSFPDAVPDLIVADNWARLYGKHDPADHPATQERLYDLALKVYWPQAELAPGGTRLFQMAIDLRPPDFATPVFVRWDLPSSFALTDNLMFPREFRTYLEIANTTGRQVDATLSLDLPSVLSAEPSERSLSLDSRPAYQELDMRSNLVFEDGVFDVGLRLAEGGVLLDELRRSFFLPATPVTDTGLEKKTRTGGLPRPGQLPGGLPDLRSQRGGRWAPPHPAGT